jgi:hypothetical protein
VTLGEKFATAAAMVVWSVAVGIGALIFAGERMAPCFQGIGPAAKAAHDACAAAYFAAHPQRDLLNLLSNPVPWVALLIVGLVAIWRATRPLRA